MSAFVLNKKQSLLARRNASAGTSYGPVSVTSQCCVETVELIGLIFGMKASFNLSYLVLYRNLGISKNKGTSLWKFAPNSAFRKFHHSISIVKVCYQLSSRKVDAPSIINWAILGQLS